MFSEIIGGVVCKSNSIIIDGILKLSDICTFVVSIKFLEYKMRKESGPIDKSIVKSTLFLLIC